MSGLAKTFLALGLLVVTNLATFGWATWRCRQEAVGHERLLSDSSTRTQQLETEVATLQRQLESVAVWRELVELQRDVSQVEIAINRLNFGDAIAGLDRVEKRLERGEYGATFQQRRAELQVPLLRCREALRATDPEARTHLVELEQEAFRLISGGRDVMPPNGPPAPAAVVPSPSPETGALLAPTPSPSPAPSPSPTASPGGPV
jgi:hypothetical protein